MDEVVRFDRFSLNTVTVELSSSGSRIHLTRRSGDVLLYLVRHHNRVITHDELRREVWGVAALSPSSIPTCIGSIRQALGDDHSAPSIIETVRARGYRFIAPLIHDRSTTWAKPGSSFVGRAREREALIFELAQSRAGSRFILVSGDAGIGKTRLIEEFARTASTADCRLVIVAIPETGAAPALWPWARALRELAVHHPGVVASHPATRRLIVPSWAGEVAPSVIGVGPVATGELKFMLFDAVATMLREIASREPLGIIFDDLHRADPSSISLLRHVHQDLYDSPILMVATVRSLTQDAQPNGAGQLLSLPRSRSLPLGPLHPGESARLVALRLGNADAQMQAAIRDRAAGNPLLLVRLADSLSADDARAGFPDHLPLDLRDAVLQITAGFSDAQIGALSAAAVIGRVFSASIASDVLGLSQQNVQADLAVAAGRGIVVGSGQNPDELRFSHVLVRDALYDQIPSHERSRLHLAVAQALEARHQTALARNAATLEHHYFQAVHIGGAAKAVEFAGIAAEYSRSCGALEDVPGHHRISVEAASYCEGLAPRDVCVLHVRLGEAEIVAGSRSSGRAVLLESFRVAQQHGLADMATRAALSFAPGSLAIEVGVYDSELVGLLEGALSMGGKAATTSRARLLARLSLALAWSGNETRRSETALESLRLARRLGDSGTLALALVAEHSVLGGPENLSKRIDLTAELSEVASACRDRDLMLMHRLLRVTAMLESGQTRALDAEIDRFEADATTTRLPHFMWYTDLYRAMRFLMNGKFATAAKHAESFIAAGAEIQDENASHSFGAHCAFQLWETGRSAEAARVGEEFVRRFPTVPAWDAAVAVFEYDAGLVDRARNRIQRISSDFGDLPRNQVWTTNAAILSEACFRVGDRAMARSLYSMLSPGAGQIAVLGFAVASLGPISRHLGILSATMDNLDDAVSHLEEARRQELDIGGHQWLARTEFDLARILIRLSASADRRRAQLALSNAGQLAAHAEMTTLAVQISDFERRAFG